MNANMGKREMPRTMKEMKPKPGSAGRLTGFYDCAAIPCPPQEDLSAVGGLECGDPAPLWITPETG